MEKNWKKINEIVESAVLHRNLWSHFNSVWRTKRYCGGMAGFWCLEFSITISSMDRRLEYAYRIIRITSKEKIFKKKKKKGEFRLWNIIIVFTVTFFFQFFFYCLFRLSALQIIMWVKASMCKYNEITIFSKFMYLGSRKWSYVWFYIRGWFYESIYTLDLYSLKNFWVTILNFSYYIE